MIEAMRRYGRKGAKGWFALLLGSAFALGLLASAAADPTGPAASKAGDARPGTVIMISLDGTRPADVTPGTLPALIELGRRGASAEAMTPVHPSNTFPNHVSLVTGVRPEVHRLVNNAFIDPQRGKFQRNEAHAWIEAEPIWSIAERAGIPTASYYWVGSEGPWTGGPGPRETRRFSSRTKEKTKVNRILKWLDESDPEKRPRVIFSWFHGADKKGHADGPGAESVARALEPQNEQIERLVREMERRGLFESTTLIFVSDHGMVGAERRVNLGRELGRLRLGVSVIGVGGFSSVIFDEGKKSPAAIARVIQRAGELGLTAHAQADAPASWHVADPRFGDVVVRAPIGTAIVTATTLIDGFHGYVPSAPEMSAVFFARGRGVRPGTQLGRISNLQIAPTVLRLLELPIPSAMKAAPSNCLPHAESHSGLLTVHSIGLQGFPSRVLSGGLGRRASRRDPDCVRGVRGLHPARKRAHEGLAFSPPIIESRGLFVTHQTRLLVLAGIAASTLIAAAAPAQRPGLTHADSPGSDATLADIEACASRNLPEEGGLIGFRVDAIDRSGAVTSSRAELRWRKNENELARVLLRISEPARTAGTAVLIVDREADEPEFFVRLPDIGKTKRVRSRRLRGPVLGTDFSYEDLNRLREPLDETELELVGIAEVAGMPAWLLEARPAKEDGSEYSRVLTYVDQQNCLPVQIDLFEGDDRLRKRLETPGTGIRRVGNALVPHVFVMHDLKRETQTRVHVEHVDVDSELPAEQFTRRALDAAGPAAINR